MHKWQCIQPLELQSFYTKFPCFATWPLLQLSEENIHKITVNLEDNHFNSLTETDVETSVWTGWMNTGRNPVSIFIKPWNAK